MTKTEIAQTIIDICRNDASFCADVKGGDQSAFLCAVADDMPDRAFQFAAERYLATFKVWGHLYFYQKQSRPYLGFRVRRYGNSLFVTRAEPSLPFSKGAEIVAIDGAPIAAAAETYAEFFDSDPPDRQGERWETVLANAAALTVRAEKTFAYPVRTDVARGPGEPSCVCLPLGPARYYLKLDNFFDAQNISAILDHAANDIERAEALIIDLRNNCGGNDTEFLPLLRFLLSETDPMCGKPIFTGADDILYTERNTAARIEILREHLASAASEEIRKFLRAQIRELKNNRGRGFLPAKPDAFVFPPHGTRRPEKVAILTDCDCASSAESFVEIAARLQKVTVVGRPTMGINDYANLARCDFGEYVLHYPTSRSRAIDSGRGTRGKGIPPDVFVPWTPKHIFEDVDLAVACDLLGKQD